MSRGWKKAKTRKADPNIAEAAAAIRTTPHSMSRKLVLKRNALRGSELI